jgi:hypothetical protein
MARKTNRRFLLVDADYFESQERPDAKVQVFDTRADAEATLSDFADEANATEVFIAEVVAVASKEGFSIKEEA